MAHEHSHAHAAHGGALAKALALACAVLVVELAGAWWSGRAVLRARPARRLGAAGDPAHAHAQRHAGALITLAPHPLYAAYAASMGEAAALADQQLAGLIMWVPMGMAYLVAAVAITARALGPDPRWREAAP